VFVSYFLSGGTPVRYDDLLANDVEMFIGYRRRLTRHGVFELPLNLKRSHISYAHTDTDIDWLLQATEQAVKEVIAQGSSGPLEHTSSMGGAD
jgi:glutamate-1-semialdehyde 2,1-aminomutase